MRSPQFRFLIALCFCCAILTAPLLADCEDPGGTPCHDACFDGRDNDGDGSTDCEDEDCANADVCTGVETTCDNGIDDDRDGPTDCEDEDCAEDPACDTTNTEVECEDGIDDDEDGCIDGADSDCGGVETDCTDNVDNDCDDRTDCADADCAEDPNCDEETICNDGIDNDNDGVIDCDDIDCAQDAACPEDCTNGVDDDADGHVDCADAECANHPDCQEICDNGIDDDEDGAIDCDDEDCADAEGCVEDCTNGIDDDGNGLIDCEDPDCLNDPACQEVCDNGVDDDGDGAVDCDDEDCAEDPACEQTEDDCTDGQDNDGDGRVDCDDPDCDSDPACNPEICNDGVDNDGDGAVDCDDSDCTGDPACPELCGDGVDNDGDGLVDCDDEDCAGDPACPEICDDGEDNDGDGSIDCDDPDCDGDPACTEICDDGEDNDQDGLIDCEDPDCDADPACLPVCGDGVCEDGRGESNCSCTDDCGRVRKGERGKRWCSNGVDDDCDGAADCSDTTCVNQRVCQNPPPAPLPQESGDHTTNLPIPSNATVFGAVVLGTGEFYLEVDDLVVPFAWRGVEGMPVRRVYRSQLVGGSPFGAGWTSDLFPRLHLEEGRPESWSDGMGNVAEIEEAPDGEHWVLSSGELLFATEGGYRWVAPGPRSCQYDSEGYVARCTDLNGIELDYRYRGGLLNRIEHSDGSWVRFRYNEDGMLHAVFDSSGQIARYDRDDRGDLTEVHVHLGKSGESKTSTYRYSWGASDETLNHNLIDMTNRVEGSAQDRIEVRHIVYGGSGFRKDKVVEASSLLDATFGKHEGALTYFYEPAQSAGPGAAGLHGTVVIEGLEGGGIEFTLDEKGIPVTMRRIKPGRE